MPRTNRNLTEKITIQITRPMLADLQNIATKSSKPLAEIVRQAIRNALDDTDLTLGNKRRFDRRFQKRFQEMETHRPVSTASAWAAQMRMASLAS